MYKKTYEAPSVPTANIAVNKSRLKVYNNTGDLPTYYLQKGQEFQIELFNPTTDVILAKIILNGKPISQGGLVLNPGQRVFLDRYLDVAKKFLFDTYEVSGSEEVRKAIENNGDFKVEFYRERVIDYYFNNPITINTLGNYNSTTANPRCCTTSTLTNGSDITFTNTSNIVGTTAFYNSSLNQNINRIPPTLDYLDGTLSMDAPKESKSFKRSVARSKSIETGRVEKGSDSDQKITTVSKQFEYFAFHTIECKLLPISQKINTVGEIQVKRYCTNCGAKLGKGHKFCSSCGTKA